MQSTLSARQHSAYKSGWSVVRCLLGWWLRDGSAAPECTVGARARAPDQAWPPTVVDLHRTDCPAEKGPTRGSCDIPNYTDMKILPLFILLACIAWQAYAQDDEPRAAPPRALLKRGPLVKGKTTTTTPAPAEDEAEYDEEDYPAEVDGQEAATVATVPSTTESKKLVGGGVRPFRSNTDLLELLKRKRAQAAEAKLNGPASTAATQPQDNGAAEAAKSNYSAKNKKRPNSAPVTREVSNDDAPPAPAKPIRGRFAATRSVQETEEEQNEPAPPARSSRNFRRGGN